MAQERQSNAWNWLKAKISKLPLVRLKHGIAPYIMLFTCLGFALWRVFAPDARIDLVTLGFVALGFLPWVASYLESFDGLGLKLKTRDAREAVAAVKDSGLLDPPLIGVDPAQEQVAADEVPPVACRDAESEPYQPVLRRQPGPPPPPITSPSPELRSTYDIGASRRPTIDRLLGFRRDLNMLLGEIAKRYVPQAVD